MTRSAILFLIALGGCGRPDPFSPSVSTIVLEVDYAPDAAPYTSAVPGVGDGHFLRTDEIDAAFAAVGMRAETFLFGGGTEQVVVGRKSCG